MISECEHLSIKVGHGVSYIHEEHEPGQSSTFSQKCSEMILPLLLHQLQEPWRTRTQVNLRESHRFQEPQKIDKLSTAGCLDTRARFFGVNVFNAIYPRLSDRKSQPLDRIRADSN